MNNTCATYFSTHVHVALTPFTQDTAENGMEVFDLLRTGNLAAKLQMACVFCRRSGKGALIN